jgi:YVTN family beta-propeller protein
MGSGIDQPGRRPGPVRFGLVIALPLVVVLVAVVAARVFGGGGGGQETGSDRTVALSPVRRVTPSPTSLARRSTSGLSPAGTPRPTASTPAVVADPSNLYAADGRGQFSPAVKGFPERVYVPNTKSGTVDEIDPKTYKIVKVLQVGGVPHHVTPSWDLRRLYVDNPGSGALEGIDPRTGRRTKTIDVPSPYNLYFTPDGTKALVVAEYHQLIQFRDRKTWKVLKDVAIPWAGVDHMDFSANGRYLLTSCEYSGEVVRIDDVKMRVTGHVHVGGQPVDVKISPDGKVFYVANQGLGGVTVIDPVRLRQITFIPTGVGAHGMAVSRNARFLYVSNRIAGTISVISFKSRDVVSTWPVGGSPDMLQVSPDGKQLWASNRFANSISVISTATGRVVHTIVVGSAPHGLAFFPQPGRYSVGHNGVFR